MIQTNLRKSLRKPKNNFQAIRKLQSEALSASKRNPESSLEKLLSLTDRPTTLFERLTYSEQLSSLRSMLAAGSDLGELFIFAYGSMMWNPLFVPLKRKTAWLLGYRRSFCVWSLVSRGTPQNQGIVLGLEECPGSRCQGVLFQLSRSNVESDLLPTWQREMYTAIYKPRWLDINTGKKSINAIVFTVDTHHPQFATGMDKNEIARIIAKSVGENGPCREYLSNTVQALASIGCSDPEIEALDARVKSLSLEPD